MSEAEHKKMMDTGYVQESRTGTTHVGSPANPDAFGKQAPPGSVYVEFDVPTTSLKATQEGWAKVLGPRTVDARLARKRGQPVPEIPPAQNIRLLKKKEGAP